MKKITLIILVLIVLSGCSQQPFGGAKNQEHLKLKVSKDKIVSYREIDNHGRKYTAYKYEELDPVAKDEIINKRTRSSKTYKTEDPNKFRTVVSSGLPYEKKQNGKWYKLTTATTSISEYRKQTKKSLISRLINTVFATDTNEQVGASEDDAHIDGTNDDEYSHTSSSLYIGKSNGDNGSYIAGARFQTVVVDQGATIDTATTQLDGWYDPGGDPQALTVYGEDVDDAATFSTGSDPHDRTKTSASVAWTGLAGFSLDWNTSPDIKTVIQEIVDRGSWSSGNDIVLLYDDNGTADWYTMEFTAYDGSSSLAPKLDITWTASVSDTCTPPASGDWTVNLGDDCYVTSDTYIIGDIILIDNLGSGCLNIIDGAVLSAAGWEATSTREYICLESDDGSALKTWTAT